MKTGTTIAMLYDFDKTLCTKAMQEYAFIPAVGMDAEAFWKESNGLAKKDNMDRILTYMYLMIKKANAANQAVRREDFVRLGQSVEYFPGVETWFDRMNAYAESKGAVLEHYIISSGLKEIIEGTSIAKNFKEIFACSYHYDVNGVADWPAVAVNFTGKTQFLFRINKGVHDITDDDSLNHYVNLDERPIPFRNMLYFGDGWTDVPCMRLVKSYGGYAIAVYEDHERESAGRLMREDRVNFVYPSDYSEGGELETTVKHLLDVMILKDKLKEQSMKQEKEFAGH